MATNGITSSKLPPRLSKSSKIIDANYPALKGDTVLESMNGHMGNLAQIEAAPVQGLSVYQTEDLLRQAGIHIKRRPINM